LNINDFWGRPLRKEKLRILAAIAVVPMLFAIVIAFLFIQSLRWDKSEWPLLILVVAFVSIFVWANVAHLKTARAIRDLNAVITWEFVSGPRPEDPDELRVWWWRRQFIYAWLAMAVGMLVAVAVLLLRGD
jgi:hypothetical protein